MRESSFIDKNKDNWKQLEQLQKSKKPNPNTLSELFIQLVDDLAYARTFYSARSVRIYLNDAAKGIYYKLYTNRSSKRSTFIDFWRTTLPLTMHQARFELLFSMIVFVLAVFFGVVSSIYYPEISRLILGDSYIAMTEAYIEKGDPMAVYKSANQVDMFLGITINNLRVDLLTFVMGIFAAVGSVFITFYNGIMVGVFQYFFYERDLFWESALTIWMHGTPELLGMVIACTAGVTMGKGLLFPGSYSRAASFQMSAKRGLMILAGVVPVTIFAGVIESFVTRYTEIPDMLRATIIITMAFTMYIYFVWYPKRLAQSSSKQVNQLLDEPTPLPEETYSFYAFREVGDIFTDTLAFWRNHFSSISSFVLRFMWLPLLVQLLMAYSSLAQTNFPYDIEYHSSRDVYYDALFPDILSFAALIQIYICTLLVSFLHFMFNEALTENKAKVNNAQSLFWKKGWIYPLLWFPFIAFLYMLLKVSVIFVLVVFLLFPLYWYILNAKFVDNKTVGKSITMGFFVLGRSVGNTLVWCFFSLFIVLLCYSFLSSPLTLLHISILDTHFLEHESLSYTLSRIFYLSLYMSFFWLVVPFVMLGLGFVYTDVIERSEHRSLREEIATLSIKSKKL
ncbi:MAG: stage II sporulation protein M [Bernardetiaceae bacterium]|nr:stage II sporulation protein M [Bernardetiaceae bacterium]